MTRLDWLIAAGAAMFGAWAGRPWIATIERLGARLAERKRAVMIGIAAAVMLIRVALLWAIPVPVPRVHDEFSYLLQADTFMHGRLANPPHPMWIFFESFHVVQHPTYASMYPPAQGAVLAIGQLLGHPWIGVLLSIAAMYGAIAWALQGWFPAKWAFLGVALLMLQLGATCYWIDSYWGGAVAATGGALVLGALPRIIHQCRMRDAIVMGIGVTLLANSRPFEGFLSCVPVAIALLIWLRSRRSPGLSVTGPRIVLPLLYVIGFALVFIGYYNWRVTGDALLFPHVVNQRQYGWRVFVWEPMKPPLHYLNQQFYDFYNVYMPTYLYRRFTPLTLWKCHIGWQFFLGITFSIPMVTLPWVLRDRRARLLWSQCLLCGLGLLSIVYFEPHYLAPLAATIFALLILGMRHLRRWEFGGWRVGIFATRLVVLLALARFLFLAGDAIRHPPQRWSWQRARVVKQLEAAPGNQLVLVHYGPAHDPNHEWVYNAADIDHSKIVWAREIPGLDVEPLLDYFRDRKVWVVNADAQPFRFEPYQASVPATVVSRSP